MKIFLSLLALIGLTGCATNHEESRSWQAVHLGMSRQQIYALIGRPDESFPEESHTDCVWWARDHWNPRSAANHPRGLDIEYDGDGRAVGVGSGLQLVQMKVSLNE